jgi:GT2 family glycosyltransferase
MRAAVLVLSWNGGAELRACLEAVQAQEGAVCRLLVVDNGSADGSADVARQAGAEVIENWRNLGFAAGMNVGLRALLGLADGRGPEDRERGRGGDAETDRVPQGSERSTPHAEPDAVVLLNQDTLVEPGWLRAVLAPLEDARVGAVGCKILYPDGRTLQHAGMRLDPGRLTARHDGYGEPDRGQYDAPRDVPAVTGAALALRAGALRAVGLLDEGYTPAYYEDIDLCWRLRRAGYTVRYEPRARLRHAESRSLPDVVARSALMERNRLRFAVKSLPPEQLWGAFLPAERLRLSVLRHGAEARALRRAYLEAALRAGEWVAARRAFYPVGPAEERRIRRLCLALRREMVEWDRVRE